MNGVKTEIDKLSEHITSKLKGRNSMVQTNGKNGSAVWVRWLVGILWGVVVMIIMFMGNVVRGNDLQNRKEHKTINESISDFRVEQMRQGTILERIDKKL